MYRIKDTYTFTENPKTSDVIAAVKANPDYYEKYTEQFTNATGEYTWSNLPLGYYILEETTKPVGKDYFIMSPTIISVPYGVNGTANGSDGWNYNIHVYPKNVLDEEIVKDIDSTKPEWNKGDVVPWSITTKVNPKMKPDGAGDYGTMLVKDQLDERLTYVADSIVVKGIKDNDVEVDLDDTFYTFDAGTTTTNLLTWTFTKEQVKALFDAEVRAV